MQVKIKNLERLWTLIHHDIIIFKNINKYHLEQRMKRLLQNIQKHVEKDGGIQTNYWIKVGKVSKLVKLDLLVAVYLV